MKTNVTTSFELSAISSNRFYWLDWMKAIGIGLIVYGHFFSLYDIYVYVFSVPLFFLISGFLTKRETDNKVFWKKITYNLVMPLLIICIINYLIRLVRVYIIYSKIPENPLLFIIQMFVGIHRAVGTFWFVYTLIILKVIFQYTKKTYLHVLWTIIFLICAYLIKHYDIVIYGKQLFKIPWSIPNTFVAYPFFIIGHYLRLWKKEISSYKIGINTIFWILFSLFIIFICGYNHQYVFLYMCGYGDNLFLFLIGGLAGSSLIFFISKVLEIVRWKAITDISIGTTIILGFHGYFIDIFRHFFRVSSIADVLFSIVIVLMFIPIIRLCASYIPILMGKYRIKK